MNLFASSAAKNTEVVALFGLPIHNVTMDAAVSEIDSLIQSGQTHQIATANLDFVRNARRSEKLQEVICDCSLVVADGAPLVWASKLMGKKLAGRVTGVDLVPALCKLSAEKGYGIFLLGSSDENAAVAMEKLQGMYPGVKFAGQYAPAPAPLDMMNNDEIVRRVNESGAQILLVAFGNPKQELWLAQNRRRLMVPVSIGVGGALEMIAGVRKRAPKMVQAMQMEWAFRMLQEPGRLLPRYAHDFAALMRYLPGEVSAKMMQPRDPRISGFSATVTHGQRVVTTPASLTGYACQWLEAQAEMAAKEGKELVVDMESTSRVESDGLGCMLLIRRNLHAAGATLRFEKMTAPVSKVLRSTGLEAILTPTYTVSVAAPARVPQTAQAGGQNVSAA
jgi:N-acetylglucosaminyldiphosphoundecaprenol N-acetyl-beta-D-mannosaminyltransferase